MNTAAVSDERLAVVCCGECGHPINKHSPYNGCQNVMRSPGNETDVVCACLQTPQGIAADLRARLAQVQETIKYITPTLNAVIQDDNRPLEALARAVVELLAQAERERDELRVYKKRVDSLAEKLNQILDGDTLSSIRVIDVWKVLSTVSAALTERKP